MSGVEALATAEVNPPAPDYDAIMGEAYDRITTQNGADRDDNGKFISPNPVNDDAPIELVADEGDPASALEGADKGESADEPVESTLQESAVSPPPSWQARRELWDKLDPDTRKIVAETESELNRKLTDQGRQIAAAKPIHDTVSQFKHLYEGRTKPDGSPVSATEATAFLFDAQAKLDNPQTRLQTIMGIIDSYGARDHLAAILTGKAQIPASPQQPSLTPRDIEAAVEKKLSEAENARQASEEVTRLSKGMPLFSQIPEDTMVTFIKLAWNKLGASASKADVLANAYDMATNADPDLRAKRAAATTAPATRTVSTADAKRANAVNVTSTSTGKVKQPSLDETLEQIWEKNRKG